jgi:hypothetical protein
MTSEKFRLLSTFVGVVALMATPALANSAHKAKPLRPDAAMSADAYASQAQQPYESKTIVGWEGQALGTDPDPNIRFQLMRDQNLGGD